MSASVSCLLSVGPTSIAHHTHNKRAIDIKKDSIVVEERGREGNECVAREMSVSELSCLLSGALTLTVPVALSASSSSVLGPPGESTPRPNMHKSPGMAICLPLPPKHPARPDLARPIARTIVRCDAAQKSGPNVASEAALPIKRPACARGHLPAPGLLCNAVAAAAAALATAQAAQAAQLAQAAAAAVNLVWEAGAAALAAEQAAQAAGAAATIEGNLEKLQWTLRCISHNCKCASRDPRCKQQK